MGNIDIDAVIKQILESSRVSAAGDERRYTDQPIIRPASQLNNYLPERCRELRRLSFSTAASRWSTAELFYRGARLMADYEDEFDFHGEFVCYYPTYSRMNDVQLRGYFSWRTRLRAGSVQRAPLGFAFVYMYELIHLIGAATPSAAFNLLRDFWTEYRAYDDRIDSYASRWLYDMVVYYNLDRSLLLEFTDAAAEQQLCALQRGELQDDGLFDALNSLSTYHLENSRFYRDYPEDVRAVTCGVYADLTAFYGKNHKYSLFEKLFGRMCTMPYNMFSSAVFYDFQRYEQYEYVASGLCSYRCEHGRWSCRRLYGKLGHNSELGALLKSIDRIMRQQYGYRLKLKDARCTKALHTAVLRHIALLAEQRERARRPVVELDLSQLDTIRRQAQRTAARLIVDPEEQQLISEPPTVATPAPEPPVAADGPALPLTTAERAVLRCLLEGSSAVAAAREQGVLLSVAIDSINDKLFEHFSDTVIEYDGEQPMLIEDYTDELKGLIL